MSRVLLKVAPLALALTLSSLAHAAVTGEVKGKVTDDAGKPLAGVTVVVVSPALQGEQAELTDVDGYYLITNLPPGTYVVRFFYENVAKPRFERQNVVISADKTVMVNAKIRTKEAKVETYTITERAPAVDVGTTNVGTTLTPEVVKNIPTGRNYEGVLGLTPGAKADDLGFGFSGATSLENSYLIDGVNTTGALLGSVVSNLPIDFAQEIQVLTGGYNAEWGRATGGFVNIITKQGSNEFHGGVWMFTGTRFASPRTVERLNQALTRDLYANTACAGNTLCVDFGADVAGPIVKDKLWFYVAFMPQLAQQQWRRNYRMILDADADGEPDLDQTRTVNCPSYLKDRGLCTGRAAPYAMRDISSSRKYTDDSQKYNFQTKLTFRLNPDNDITLSVIGGPSKTDGFNAARYVGQEDRMHRGFEEETYDASLRYMGKFANRKIQVEALVAYHHEKSTDLPSEYGKNHAAVLHQPERSLAEYNKPGSTEFPLQCGDPDPSDNYNPCPIQSFITGGHGYYEQFKADRVNFMLRATGYLRAAGHHAFKIGFDPQMTYAQNTRAYTQGYYFDERLPDALGRGRLRTYRAFATNATNNSCAGGASAMMPYWGADAEGNPVEENLCFLDKFQAKSQTREYAAFLQDQWSILPNLTVNFGVRWEGMQIIGAEDYKGIEIMNNWAPRVGLVYDWTGEGKSKVYASYGRFFESMPLDINDRAFSAEGFMQEIWRYQSVDAMYQACGGPASMNPAGCKPTALNSTSNAYGTTPGVYRTLAGGERATVVSGLKAQRSDQIVIGAQYEIIPDLVVGAAYHKRWLGSIIEDVSPDYANTYYIANPGYVPSTAQLEKDVAALQGKTDPESLAKLAELQKSLADYKALGKFPKASRDYNSFELTAAKRFSKSWYLNASYVYARTIGNYPGLYQATNGQSDPNITSAFDLKDLLLNMSGPLPQDSPHTILVSGYKSWKVYSKGTLVTGLTARASSGYPINVLGSYPYYGSYEVYLLPRGEGGRTPWLYTVDLALRYQQQLSKNVNLSISVDLFNLFNLDQVGAVDELYSSDDTQPINNGRVADLKHLKNYDGLPATKFYNYGNATAYQRPISGRFGLRLTF